MPLVASLWSLRLDESDSRIGADLRTSHPKLHDINLVVCVRYFCSKGLRISAWRSSLMHKSNAHMTSPLPLCYLHTYLHLPTITYLLHYYYHLHPSRHKLDHYHSLPNSLLMFSAPPGDAKRITENIYRLSDTFRANRYPPLYIF